MKFKKYIKLNRLICISLNAILFTILCDLY